MNTGNNRDPELEVDYDGFATRQEMVDWWSTAIRKAATAERLALTQQRQPIDAPPCDLTSAMFDRLFERYGDGSTPSK